VNVHQISAHDRRAIRAFVRLEREFMADYPLFWSPPDSDVQKQLSGRSAFFDDMEHTMFVAEREGRPVARCAALINRAWQSCHAGAEMTGFIGYFAARPDAAAVTAQMLARAEAWLAERGVQRVIAGVNGSALTGMAILTDAFDQSPMFPLPWNPPYYAHYLEAAGYAPSYPLWVFEIDFGSEQYREVAQRVLGSPLCEIRPIDKRRWAAELETLRELFNEGLADEWELQQFSAAEFEEAFGQLRMVLDARLIQFAVQDGRPIGFVLGITDLVPLLRSFRGRFGPLQILRLMLARARRTRAGALAGALLPEYRGQHIGTMAVRFFRDLEEMGFKSVVYFPVNDVNTASRRLAEAIGGRGRVLYHCFDKHLG
jgi:GNAT superfamily N-acetyltransferase